MTRRLNIVAIPGAGMSAAVYGGLAPHLLDYYLEPLSFPGHDKRVAGPLLMSIAEMAGYVRQRLSGAPEKSNILMGHSMGALVALEAASDPSVAGIILMGAAQKMPVHADLLQAAKDEPGKAMELIIKWGVCKDHPQIGAVRIVLSSLMREAENDALYHDLKACDDYAGAENPHKPALVIAGAEDKMTKAADGRALAEFLNGGYVEIAVCGHMMMVENPMAVAAEIRKFISAITD